MCPSFYKDRLPIQPVQLTVKTARIMPGTSAVTSPAMPNPLPAPLRDLEAASPAADKTSPKTSRIKPTTGIQQKIKPKSAHTKPPAAQPLDGGACVTGEP